MRLGAEHGDAQMRRPVALQQFLDRAHPGHAIADDNQMFAGVRGDIHVLLRKAMGGAESETRAARRITSAATAMAPLRTSSPTLSLATA